jgi:5,10-methenyltetrahydrofolate synthetase
VAGELDRLIPSTPGAIVSLYWPFRGELDLRDWMRSAAERGLRIALPVVVEKGQPLLFREWVPGARLTRGIWNIPIPVDGAAVTPSVIISPVVGFDPQNYRLGYGGGFFDRTLAAINTANPQNLYMAITSTKKCDSNDLIEMMWREPDQLVPRS